MKEEEKKRKTEKLTRRVFLFFFLPSSQNHQRFGPTPSFASIYRSRLPPSSLPPFFCTFCCFVALPSIFVFSFALYLHLSFRIPLYVSKKHTMYSYLSLCIVVSWSGKARSKGREGGKREGRASLATPSTSFPQPDADFRKEFL